MDPVSQGVVGSMMALSFAKPQYSRIAAFAGCVGGMLADADIFIRSQADPLLNIEYHRHFSHALAFIPFGGLIAFLFLWPFLRRRIPAKSLYLYSLLGYATAGLLDACTSYGTQLLWPFSDHRVAWSIISIIDPLFTATLLVLVLIAFFKRQPRFGRIATVFALAYLSLGTWQNHRASQALSELQTQRGHSSATRSTVKPSIANLVLWRSVYLYQNEYYVDAVRVGFLQTNRIYPGSKLTAFDFESALSQLEPEDPVFDDLQRFHHFSDGYLATLPDEPNFLTDLRYSAIPNAIEPLWGLDLKSKTKAGHLLFITRRDIDASDRANFKDMILGR